MTINSHFSFVLARLKQYRDAGEGAVYTSDISTPAHPTNAVCRVLQRMEKDGLVERVVKGNPTSWKLAEGVGK